MIQSVFYPILFISGLLTGIVFTRAFYLKKIRAQIKFNQNITDSLYTYKDQLEKSKSRLEIEKEYAVHLALSKEQKRIAMDLHDEMGSFLIDAQLQLETIQKNSQLPLEVLFRLESVREIIHNLSKSIRFIIHNLTPDDIVDVNVSTAIQHFLKKKEALKKFHFHFNELGQPYYIKKPQELIIYRLIQELVTNSIKHSVAWNIWVKLIWEYNRIIIEVEDDGAMLSPKIISESIKKRIKTIEAKLIRLEKFKGLHIQIVVNKSNSTNHS